MVEAQADPLVPEIGGEVAAKVEGGGLGGAVDVAAAGAPVSEAICEEMMAIPAAFAARRFASRV